MDAGMMPLRVGNSFLCLFVAVMSSVVHTSISLPHYGDALVKTRARRDDARYLGRENTVPVRLMYRMDGDTQTAHDVLNTRVRMSSDSKQNHAAQASFQVGAFGQTFVLDVELNHLFFYAHGELAVGSVLTDLRPDYFPSFHLGNQFILSFSFSHLSL
ncbi:Disintegrin and metalloproteinase domain-containing protein 22 [Anabarilius grahami]|uniref:Disintegrin and metalloproteinase domain-containing protein 22 n=1 Tax=Anabarilius grahami TaxID=495550 RepID=A0A3N0Y5L7_ANAGA|nr:Disintegrin and metalloproteinase domain-containing protein 22 [Anabarilius grahami]